MAITEDEIRREIRKTLYAQYFYEKSNLHEGGYAYDLSPGEFSKIFVDPWKDAFKGIFAELKKITSSALTAVRLMFTLNQKKAQEIWARQKDREAKFSKESDEAMQALGSAANDFNFATFILNPGPWMAKQMGSGAKGFVDFAKEIGIGDKSIATATGEEKEEDALIRRREQDGPVKKALRALEQIFFLAHAENKGPLIVESIAADLEDEILAGPLGREIQEQQKQFSDDVEGFIEIINSVAAQNAFLSTVARVDTANNPELGLKQMNDALKELAADDPEGAKQFARLPDEIYNEAKALAASEKFRKQVDDQAEDSSEENPDYDKKALQAVMGATFEDNVSEFVSAIDENNKMLVDTFEALFSSSEIDKETVSVIDEKVDGFATALRVAEKVLQKRLIS